MAPVVRALRSLVPLLATVAGIACAPPSATGPATSDPDTARAVDPPVCAAVDPAGVAACVDPARYAADLRFVAQPRPPGSAHHIRVQAMCAEVFERAGYDVVVDRYRTGTNVLGVREGDESAWVLYGAHYDHLPGCDGADDNASGVAAVLELSRVLAAIPTRRTIAFACWDEEERGLVGSRDWARRLSAAAIDVSLYVNFDAIAFADDRPDTQAIPTGFGLLFADEVERLRDRQSRADFIALVADPKGAPFASLIETYGQSQQLPAALLEIPQLVKDSGLVYDLQRSDHASLWDVGVGAVMITDTAEFRSDAYHCRDREDDVDSLDLTFATRVVRATAAASAHLLAESAPTK